MPPHHQPELTHGYYPLQHVLQQQQQHDHHQHTNNHQQHPNNHAQHPNNHAQHPNNHAQQNNHIQQSHPPAPGSTHSHVMYAPYQPLIQQQGTPTLSNHHYGNQHSPQAMVRDSYGPPSSSVYSSNAPPSYHRSYTPSSSRSCHSNDSVKYTIHDTRVTSNHMRYDKTAADV